MAALGAVSGLHFKALDHLFFSQPPSVEWRTHKHRLAGTVTVNGLPARKRILVLRRYNNGYLASTMSSAEGLWEIKGLPQWIEDIELIVLAFDDRGLYNAEVADKVKTVL